MERSDPASAALRWVRSRSVTGEHLPARARVALHFNPGDDASEAGVLASILDQGLYVSQFVTGTSNGGLTAFAGGDRWRWEQRIFGGAYDYVDVQHRPVYGALDLDGDPYGPAPRFGSAYLRLRPETLARATFAYPDSTFGPELFGVADRMGLIADFRRDEVENAGRCGLVVETHPGYVAEVAEIAAHPEYRGQDVVDLAQRIAEDLANSMQLRPIHVARARRVWDLDGQQSKKVWHCLARFGRTW